MFIFHKIFIVLGSIFKPRYIQNRVIMNSGIERFVCILLISNYTLLINY